MQLMCRCFSLGSPTNQALRKYCLPLLQVVRENRPGMLPETKGPLYVGGLNEPFAFLTKMKREVRELNNRIVECTYDTQAQKWVFMRERTDKSYPNGYKTAQGEAYYPNGCKRTTKSYRMTYQNLELSCIWHLLLLLSSTSLLPSKHAKIRIPMSQIRRA